jgi:ABC-type Fe3+-hydroxamate transport system substrate-binding protein
VIVHATRVRSLADVPSALSGIREAVGIEAGPEFIEGCDPLQPQPPVLTAWIPIWRRPWMSIGRDTYATSILAAAGIANVFGDSSAPYPPTDIDDAAARSPDVVLAPSEPYRFAERHRRELELVAPVVFVDGQDLFWWGSRTPSALGRLRRLAAGLAAR